MIRRRFDGARLARIIGWTAAATAWVTVGIARVAGTAGTSGQAEAPAPPEAPVQAVTQATRAAVPVMPDGGLVILRYTPAPTPAPQPVAARVVTQRVVVQAPPAPKSSGS